MREETPPPAIILRHRQPEQDGPAESLGVLPQRRGVDDRTARGGVRGDVRPRPVQPRPEDGRTVHEPDGPAVGHAPVEPRSGAERRERRQDRRQDRRDAVDGRDGRDETHAPLFGGTSLPLIGPWALDAPAGRLGPAPRGELMTACLLQKSSLAKSKPSKVSWGTRQLQLRRLLLALHAALWTLPLLPSATGKEALPTGLAIYTLRLSRSCRVGPSASTVYNATTSSSTQEEEEELVTVITGNSS
mmetsp:Transcript_11653/g.27389  ORF Transcript_11653/g.27389 Transcript_11653/m.27389 type:complete len:245 (-) Transcript_11653:2-736(-)